MDNTCATNKNWYTMAWTLETISQQKLEFRISFLIAGHTKFSPDLIFSKITQSYNCSNVFCTEDMKQVIAPHANVTVEIVHDWRTNQLKYSKLPGICNLHDFVFVRSASTNKLVCKVRKLCHGGQFKLRELSDTKLSHLHQMSMSFIPVDHRLPFL